MMALFLRAVFWSLILSLPLRTSGNEILVDEDRQLTTAKELLGRTTPLIIAHRGFSRVAPENTLIAFDLAVKAKADLIELDYFETDEGKLVVFHDKDLNRTTDAISKLGKDRAIWQTAWSDLQKLDAGTWKNSRYRGARIPSLDQAIEVIQKGSVTLIEHKRGSAKNCLALLEKLEVTEHVVVQSFDWNFVSEVERLAPKVVTVALGKNDLKTDQLRRVKQMGCAGVGWNHKDISKKQIDLAHEHGLKIWVYTVNDVRRARQLLAEGIDGIITDDPEIVISERNRQ